MTIRQMELFAQVYERRNLTRAAEALYMTQSAVTQNLKKMEEELGIQLFERVNRRLQPSLAGERFYQHAKRILDEYEKTLAELASSGEQMSLYFTTFSPPRSRTGSSPPSGRSIPSCASTCSTAGSQSCWTTAAGRRARSISSRRSSSGTRRSARSKPPRCGTLLSCGRTAA